MGGDGKSAKLSPGRIFFLCATVVALAYSIYSLPGMIGLQGRAPAAGNAQGVAPLPPSSKPAEADLAGVWVPDEVTAARLRDLNSGLPAATRLDLGKGSFELVGVPYFSRGGIPRVELATWRGSWNLYRQQDTWAVYLMHQEAEGRGLLYREGPGYRMVLTLGDPSINEPLSFVRRR